VLEGQRGLRADRFRANGQVEVSSGWSENHDDGNPWARGLGLEKWSTNKHEIGSIYGDHVPLLVRDESVGKYMDGSSGSRLGGSASSARSPKSERKN
jgi:hypothetical protein